MRKTAVYWCLLLGLAVPAGWAVAQVEGREAPDGDALRAEVERLRAEVEALRAENGALKEKLAAASA